MKCPICHNEMTPGSLLARSESAIFWMKNVEDVPHLLRPKAIRAAGGIILDKKVAPGFFAWERNVTYHCAACRLFLAPEPEED